VRLQVCNFTQPETSLLMEDELNPEAYGCAAAKDQAGIVFKAAARLVNANADLGRRLRLLESPGLRGCLKGASATKGNRVGARGDCVILPLSLIICDNGRQPALNLKTMPDRYPGVT
jgi:hypothetical protein